MVNYVVGIDTSTGNAVNIPDSMKNKRFIDVVKFPATITDEHGKPSEVKWFATVCHHPKKNVRSWLRTGGQPVVQRLCDKINIQSVYIDRDFWENMSCDEQKVTFIKQKFNI